MPSWCCFFFISACGVAQRHTSPSSFSFSGSVTHTHTHTHTHIKETTCEMVLNSSKALLFWVTVEGFFSCCDASCGQGVEQLPKGRGCWGRFVFGFDFLSDQKPLGALWQDLDQNALFMYPQLSFWTRFILQFASFNTASGIISESIPYSFLMCQAG